MTHSRLSSAGALARRLLRAQLRIKVMAGVVVVTLVALFGALAIWQAAIRFGANFLFERPDAFWIAPKKAAPALQPAE